MKSNNVFLGLSIMFLVIAIAFSLVIWKDTSLSSKIAFFACGFGSGILAGRWVAGLKK